MKKAYRIKDRDEFAMIFKQGKTSANRQFVVYVLDKPEQEHFRVGFTVGKKSRQCGNEESSKKTDERTDPLEYNKDFPR
ncbi:ribonuclease P protein component [Geomicrobium sp. JCM 19055]|nr:ribonuclease P protein component [Geomicrobium sp. JCM 19055]